MINETLWAGGMALLSQCYSQHGYDVVSANNIASTISNVFNVAFLAMGNAIDTVKEAADVVIGSNDEDGIAVFLENEMI